jgi:hypothetical protein
MAIFNSYVSVPEGTSLIKPIILPPYGQLNPVDHPSLPCESSSCAEIPGLVIKIHGLIMVPKQLLYSKIM